MKRPFPPDGTGDLPLSGGRDQGKARCRTGRRDGSWSTQPGLGPLGRVAGLIWDMAVPQPLNTGRNRDAMPDRQTPPTVGRGDSVAPAVSAAPSPHQTRPNLSLTRAGRGQECCRYRQPPCRNRPPGRNAAQRRGEKSGKVVGRCHYGGLPVSISTAPSGRHSLVAQLYLDPDHGRLASRSGLSVGTRCAVEIGPDGALMNKYLPNMPCAVRPQE